MRWRLEKVLNFVLVVFLSIYRWFLSPLIHLLVGSGAGCRFQPTCSDYSRQAIQKLGAIKGLSLSTRRILRCHPFSRGGYDPVPGSCICSSPVISENNHLTGI